MEVLRYGYRIPFLCAPPLTKAPISMPSYHPSSTKRVALEEATRALVAKSAVELAPLPSPRLLQPTFRCVEDLGVLETRHRSLVPQSLRGCVALSHGDHPVCPSLCSSGRLDGLHRPQGSLPAGPCPSGLSALPSVCGSGQCLPILCPLLRTLHGSTGLLTGHGSCFRHSPFLGYPHAAVPRRLACPVVPSRVSPSRPQDGSRSLVVDSQSFRASPSPERVAKLWSTANTFLSCANPPASTWLSLLGILSSLSHLVPGGRLRARSLQLSLHRAWDWVDQSVRIPWTPVCLRDLQWWLDLPRLSHGVSPDLDFWSDTSDVGWGAHLGSLTASAALSINARKLLAIREGLLHFRSSLVEKNVAVFCYNSTAVSYLRKEGGTRSPFLNSLARDSPLGGVPLHQAVPPVHSGVPERSGGLSLSPSPTSSYRVVSSSGGFSVYQSHVAGPNRLICNISKSPMLHLFLSVPGFVGSGHRRLPPTLGRASGLRVSSVVCNPSSSCEAQVVSGDGTHPDSSLLASASLVFRPPSPVAGPSGSSAST